MSYINDHESGTIIPLSQHIIEISGLNKSQNGFILYLDNGTPIGDYSKFTYFYRVIDNEKLIYQYSDDRSVYTEPIIEEPIVIEPTEEELRIAEINVQLGALYSQLSTVESEFSKLDYVGIKIATGRATIEEYAKEIALMNELATQKDALNAQIMVLKGELLWWKY